MNLHSQRGTVVVELILIGALAVGGAQLAGWKPFRFLQKKPPTAQVTQLQADLAKAQAAAEAAQRQLEAAAAAERERQVEQVQWAQQMTTGAGEAIGRIPSEHKTSESRLAADLIARGNFALALAVGDLPPDKRMEILRIVDQALSGVQAERDAAVAALAVADAELQRVTRQREQIAAELPVLAAKLETKEATARAIQAELTVKTGEVVAIADRLDAKDREAGSLGASVNRLLRIGAILVGVWLFLGWGAAPLLKLMRPGKLKNFLRDVIGYLTSGFLHHDAKKKLQKTAFSQTLTQS